MKDYKAEAFVNDEKRKRKYAFIIKGKDADEALINTQNHITHSYKDENFYEIELTLIGDTLTK